MTLGVIVISVLIFKLGGECAKDAVLTLMDAWLDEESAERIRKNIRDIPGILELVDLKLRKSGLVVFGEATVEVDGKADLKKVELLTPKINAAVKKEVQNLEHLVIDARPGKRQVFKLALPVLESSGLKTRLSGHLGKAPYFLFAVLEAGRVREWEILKNPFMELDRKRGVKAVEFLVNERINVLVLQEVGEGPFHMLRDNFVRICRVPEGTATAEEVLEKVSELEEIAGPTE